MQEYGQKGLGAFLQEMRVAVVLLFIPVCSFWLVSISDICFLLTRTGKDRASEEVWDNGNLNCVAVKCSEVSGLIGERQIYSLLWHTSEYIRTALL